MSYNTRNYNTRHSGQGGGRQGNYNTSGQFVPASNTGVEVPPPPVPLQQRPPRANTVTLTPPTNDYGQMYNASPLAAATNTNNFQVNTQDVDMKVEPCDANNSAGERPPWMKTKLQGVKKLSNKERRRRQNQTLRRLLSPKNAVMVLNEVMPEQQIVNNICVKPAPANFYGGQSFAAELTVDGQSFKGYGDNKLAARTKAAEHAFRDLMIKRMAKVLSQDCNSTTGSVGMDDDSDSGTLPMLQLTSFALHKLFAEWESEGHKVPALRAQPQHNPSVCSDSGSVTGNIAGGGAGKVAVEKSPAAPRALPLNAGDMHPCMLLTYMCPRAEYREVSCSGAPPNCTFTVAVSVDSNVHTATAKSKKEARRLAAKAACEALYKVQFTPNPIAAAPITSIV